MNLTVYLRVAHGSRGPRVAASTSPNYEPLQSGSGYQAKPLPTAAFALKLKIPEEALEHAAQVLAELDVPLNEIQVAADVQSALAEVEA
jgi:hypothetical protein